MIDFADVQPDNYYVYQNGVGVFYVKRIDGTLAEGQLSFKDGTWRTWQVELSAKSGMDCLSVMSEADRERWAAVMGMRR
jgi:hypothetical protein